MKHRVAYIAGFAMVAFSGLVSAQSANRALTIMITTPKPIYALGEPVYLKIVFSNHSETQ